MSALTTVSEGELWGSFPEATRNDILGLLSMLLERLAVSPRSAANAAERPGFARLVAELTMGHVGLVLGLEMSRLARAGRDWHQLIELCSLAGALLADADGVYDPNWYNDRLLLGLSAPA